MHTIPPPQPSHSQLAGIMLCLSLGGLFYTAGSLLGGFIKANALALALLAGAILGNSTKIGERFASGIKYTEKSVLKLAIVLMGFKMSAVDILTGEAFPILVGVLSFLFSVVAVYFICRHVFKINPGESHCIAAGCSVCGSSAIMAVESLYKGIDKTKLSLLIALVGFTSTVSFVVWPTLFKADAMTFLNPRQFGVFSGASIFAVPQAIAAGGAVSPEAEGLAALTKLTRVLCLVPLVLFISFSRKQGNQKKVSVPLFILGFIAVLVLNCFPLPPAIPATGQFFSRFFMYGVMVAVGFQTLIKTVFTREVMKKTLFPVFIGYFIINTLSLVLVKIFIS